MGKKIMSLLLTTAMLAAALSGCGSKAPSSEAADSTSAGEVQTEAPAPEVQEDNTPTEEAAASEALSAAEAEPTGYAPKYHFPGSDTAKLHYSNDYALPISEDGATLTWMRTQLNLMGPLGELGLSTLQDLDAIQHLQEITGVTIDYTEIDFWTAQEKMNVAIASGDYAALISDLTYTGGATGALEDGVIVDLTDRLPDYSPNYQYMIDSNPDVASIFRNDGKVLCYHSPYDNFVQNQGLVIRQDWLDEQGLELPTTYDQMFEVLKVFRDAYNTSTAMYFNSDCKINGLTVGYDVATFAAGGTETSLPFYVVDGKVHCSLIEDGYRDYLREMNKWYNEGLFDKDFGSIAYDPMGGALAELQANGTVGLWCTSGEGIGNITQPVSCVPNLTLEEGGIDHITSTSLITDSSDTYVTACCEDVETAMQFLDYLYSEDGILFYNYGFEDVDYTIDENGTPQFTEAVTNNEYDLSPANYMRVRCGYGVFSSLMLRYRSAAYNSDINNEAWDVWSSNLDGSMTIPSNVSMTPEETETSAYYVTDIMTYACQMIPQFINGTVGFDQWDSYVENLKGMNIEACIAAEQSAYDRCME